MNEDYLNDKITGAEAPELAPEQPEFVAADAEAPELAPEQTEPAFGDAEAASPSEEKKKAGKPEKIKKEKPARAARTEDERDEPDTARDKLICLIAAGVFAALAIVFVCLLASSLSDMASVMKGAEKLAVIERLVGAVAHILLSFGLGLAAIILSAMSHAFSKRAHKGSFGSWRAVSLAMRIAAAVIALAALVMMVISVALAF